LNFYLKREYMKKSLLLFLPILILVGCGSRIDVQQIPKKPSPKNKPAPDYRYQEAPVEQKEVTPIVVKPVAVDPTVVEQPLSNREIGSMLMLGFMGTTASPSSQICQDIAIYNIAGVILFDVNPIDKSQPKNIENKEQVKMLTEQLQSCSSDGKLLISVDQEGGKVQRLKSKYGFYGKFPRASSLIKLDESKIKESYSSMGEELSAVGINYNLAPVVDLAINKKNRVIYKLGRSFGKNPEEVAKYSTIFMDAMHEHGILTSLKHFPGHGSSLGDTHKGFVDVTNLWQKKELDPYRLLSDQGAIDTVMVAHVYNKDIDEQYPATLSSLTINGLLRDEIGFDGVVITDDLQMGAIAQKYTLEERLKLTIGAGNDILLFGNQLLSQSMVTTQQLVETIQQLIDDGEINPNDIRKSNARLEQLKQQMR
jgi:beta-N-acetylhexosaminidase